MDRVEQVVNFFRAIESEDWETLEEMLDDNFRYVGIFPGSFDKDVWLQFQRAVQHAFADWSYNLKQVEEKEDGVHVTVHITATHTNDLILPLENMQPLYATNAKIKMPEEHAIVKFENGKIIELRVEETPHGGLPGLLEQLGAE